MSWKKVAYLDEVATLTAVTPDAVTVGATGAVGDGTAAARDDHVHGSPATWPPSAHTLDSHSELKLDTLAEKTATTGVTIDSCLIKDGKAADSNLLEGSNKASVQDHVPQAHALSGHTQAVAELLINKQALRNPVIDPQATAPATPVDGQVYFSTADDHLYAYVAA